LQNVLKKTIDLRKTDKEPNLANDPSYVKYAMSRVKRSLV